MWQGPKVVMLLDLEGDIDACLLEDWPLILDEFGNVILDTLEGNPG